MNPKTSRRGPKCSGAHKEAFEQKHAGLRVMAVTDDDITAVTAGVQVNATAMAKAVRVALAALALLQPVKPGQSSRTLPITPHQHPHK
jgi:hypothetical protein